MPLRLDFKLASVMAGDMTTAAWQSQGKRVTDSSVLQFISAASDIENAQTHNLQRHAAWHGTWSRWHLLGAVDGATLFSKIRDRSVVVDAASRQTVGTHQHCRAHSLHREVTRDAAMAPPRALVAVSVAVVAVVAAALLADRDDYHYHGPDTSACSLHHAELIDTATGVPLADTVSVEDVYFEGWYYKLVTADRSQVLSVVPGLIVGRRDSDGACVGEAFVMIVDATSHPGAAHLYRQSPAAFRAWHNADAAADGAWNATGFKVGEHANFRRDGLHIELDPSTAAAAEAGRARAPRIVGGVELTAHHPWPSTFLSPDAMGWFSWIPVMQCKHGVITMKSTISSGSFDVGGVTVDFTGGSAYVEKDWGSGFPKSWLWIQTHDFAAPDTSLFVSVAHIPWFNWEFPGFIIGFQIEGRLHRFATYTGAVIEKMSATAFPDGGNDNGEVVVVYLQVRDSTYTMYVNANVRLMDGAGENGFNGLAPLLFGPVDGTMQRYVREALNGDVRVLLADTATGRVLFAAEGGNAGVEVIGNTEALSLAAPQGPAGAIAGVLQLAVAVVITASIAQLALGAAVVAVLVGVSVHLCKSRREYVDPSSVGDEYDAWTTDGVLEHFWGEHVHHGYYANGTWRDGTDFVASKVDMNERLLAWAGAPRDAFGARPASDEVRVLDVGCGIGGSSRFLARYFGAGTKARVRVEGVTLSKAQVARGTQLTKAAGLADTVNARVADALDLPFPDDHFDVVWSMESGEHMPDKEAFLAEMARVLRPGGRVVMATWCTRPVPRTDGLSDGDAGGPLADAEVQRLRRVYDEWALPHFISIADYAAMAPSVGLADDSVRTGDWTHQAAPTWPHAVWEGAVGILWLIGRGPRVFFRTLRDVFAIWHMHKGYEEGTIRYGIMTALKAGDAPGRAGAGKGKSKTGKAKGNRAAVTPPAAVSVGGSSGRNGAKGRRGTSPAARKAR